MFIPLIALTMLAVPATSIIPGISSAKDPLSTSAIPNLVLVDRDGVINKDLGAPGVLHPSKLKLTTGAGSALGNLRRQGCKVAMITNQSCVGKGLITENELCNIHRRLQEMLLNEDQDAKFDKIFYCTSLKESNDYRMKPNPGMIEEAMEYFAEEAAASASDTVLFIGDTVSDLEAAARAGVPTRILVETGYGRSIMGKDAPDADGTVSVVNEGENKIRMSSTSDNYDDDASKPSIFPFVYAKNFCSAVEWILCTTTSSRLQER